MADSSLIGGTSVTQMKLGKAPSPTAGNKCLSLQEGRPTDGGNKPHWDGMREGLLHVLLSWYMFLLAAGEHAEADYSAPCS